MLRGKSTDEIKNRRVFPQGEGGYGEAPWILSLPVVADEITMRSLFRINEIISTKCTVEDRKSLLLEAAC
jgi:hypothetical protein